MKLRNLPLKKLTAAIGTCLVLGVSGPMLAQTDLVVENDGLMLSAFVGSSSQEVLSTSIRIVGPDGFVFEDRLEAGTIDWIPENGLADGVYHWEAWVVTVKPNAQIRSTIPAVEMEELDEEGIQRQIDRAPLERLYNSRDKDVTSRSGSFLIRNGWLENVNDEDALGAQADADSPGTLQRLLGQVIDLVIPSAHAQNFSDDVVITKSNPSVVLDSDASSGANWKIQGATSAWTFRDQQNNTIPFWIEPGANNDRALRIRSSGDVGLGTTTPTEPLHISDSLPRIRLEDSTDAQSWYIKAANAGNFEIGESRNVSAFRIYPETPEGSVQVRKFQATSIFGGDGIPRGRLGVNTFPQAELHLKSTPGIDFGGVIGRQASDAVIRLERSTGTAMQIRGGVELFVGRVGGSTGVFRVHGDAPNDSLRVASDGNVGIGVNSPSEKLHVGASDGSAALLVQETAASNQQRLLTLQHEGAPLFVLEDTAQSTSWTFRTGGTVGTASEGFIISKIGTGNPEMLVRANGDLQIQGTLTELSSRDRKMNIETPAYASILDKVDRLDVPQWSYINSPGSVHIGPIAQDFHSLFGYGLNDETISPRNIAGVALAAVKALRAENNELKRQLSDYADLKQRVAALESRSEHDNTIHVSY